MRTKVDKSDRTRDDPIPAPVIARAIVEACRETGADPVEVAMGEHDAVRGRPATNHPIAKARYYAGYALRALYPNRNRTTIALYVGYQKQSAGSFFSALDQRLASGLSWWRRGVVERIVEVAGEARLAAKPVPSAPAPPLKMGPLPPPKFTGPKAAEHRACYDMLAEAAANTAKLQAKLPKE